MEETKCEYKEIKATSQLLYSDTDRKYLDEFHEIAFDKSEKWNSCPASYGIKVESKQGKYGFPISRAIAIINNNHLATPQHLYLFLQQDWRMFYYLTRNVEIKLIHTINNVKRIVEAIVTPNSSVAYPRSYLYHEIFALCDEDGNIHNSHNTNNHNNNNNKRKLIAVLRSVNKNEKKYYKKPSNTQARGTFYRTGFALQCISNSESQLVITMEYDTGGSNIVRNFGSSCSKHNEWSLKMCQRFMKMLECIASYSHDIYQKYNALTVELKNKNDQILQLKRALLKVKNWKSWDIDDLILWICDVENNKFQNYKSILSKSFINQKFNVCNLDKVNEADLLAFGIENFDERKCLIQHIYTLTKHEMVDNNDKKEMICSKHKNDAHVGVIQNADDEKIDAGMYDSNHIDDDDEEEEEEEEDDYNGGAPELPENWIIFYTPDGKAYYHNEVTNVTQWTAPE